jgi:hypothetical protein
MSRLSVRRLRGLWLLLHFVGRLPLGVLGGRYDLVLTNKRHPGRVRPHSTRPTYVSSHDWLDAPVPLPVIR